MYKNSVCSFSRLSCIIRRNMSLSCRLLAREENAPRFSYVPIESNRYVEVVKHLQNFFYIDEPLSKASGLSTSEGNPDLEAYIISSLEENLSLMAVTDSGEIAGVMLNGLYQKGDNEHFDEKVAGCTTDNFRKIARILCDVNVPIDLFSKFGVDSIFDVRIASVDTKFRQHKIGLELFRQAEMLAMKKKFQVAKAEATGFYSQKILKGLGFRTINEIIYDQYLDASGKPVFKIEPPHKSVELVYKVLNS